MADTTLQFSARVAGNATPVMRSLLVKQGRVGFREGSDQRITIVFDQSQKAFAFINHADRQYTVITAEWMRQMQERARASMQRMQEVMDKQLQDMPPQQRAMYQQGRLMMPMMLPFMANVTQPNQLRTAVPLYIRNQVNGIPCNRVDLLEGGRKTQELCIAERKDLKDVAESDYDTLMTMLKVAQELDTMGAFALGFRRPFLAAWGGGTPGLPIFVSEHGNQAVITTELSRLDAGNIDSAMLQLPADYLQAEIPLPIR